MGLRPTSFSPLLPAAWICIVRYHQLRDWGVGRWPNQLILWTGLLCALGTSVVGNFQVRPSWRPGSVPAGVWNYNSQHARGHRLIVSGAGSSLALLGLVFFFGQWPWTGWIPLLSEWGTTSEAVCM